MHTEELVTKRKVGGRAGKKKWKKQSDTTNLQLHELEEAKQQVFEQSRKKSKTPAFIIQTEPDVHAKKRLDKDRFKEKEFPNTSRTEQKLLKKIEKKEEHSKSVPPPQKTADISRRSDAEAEFDLWAEKPIDLNIVYKKPEIKLRTDLDMPKVLPPHAGQSYNPSYSDQLDLMKYIVDKGEEKQRVFKTKSEKAQERAKKEMLTKRPPQKPRTKKEKELLDLHAKQREEKKKEQDYKNIGSLLNQVNNREKKLGKF